MTHKEIDEFATKFGLSWQQVFSLDAEFWSLVTIEQEEKDKEEKRKNGKAGDTLDLPEAKGEDDEDDKGQGDKKLGVEVDGASIPLKIFLQYTTSLADKFKDVNKRLISAFGIDTSNENVRIVWDQFLSLKCFLELFTLRIN
jgi:hypothetical protein